MNMKDFFKDRNEAILSLDKEKIHAFERKYGFEHEEDEEVFWAGVFYLILALKSASHDAKAKAREWLIGHGFSIEYKLGA
ncbi:MAG: hypothetical protein ACOYU3_05940 [Bacillota bacterium]